jgi:hypothetical protein
MKTLTIIKYVFLLIGAGMLIGTAFLFTSARSFVAHAVHAQGVVVALQPRLDSHHDSNSSTNYSNGSMTWAPLVRFSHNGQVIDFTGSTSSNPPSYHVNQTVPILFDPSNPFGAKIDTFFSVWGGPVILGGLGTVFFLIGALMIVIPRSTARADDRLLHEGVPVDADLQGVDTNTSLTVNGRNPFRITAQWQDPATSRVYVFVSHNIWFDPSKYVTGKNIRVYIAPGNPKRYYVDLSFLPQLAN